MAEVIYSGTPTQLPYTFQYTPNNDANALILVSGSAWTQTQNAKIGLVLSIGNAVITNASVWSNGPTTHRALVSNPVMYAFPMNIVNGQIQPVTLTISAETTNTIFDINDYVTIVSI